MDKDEEQSILEARNLENVHEAHRHYLEYFIEFW